MRRLFFLNLFIFISLLLSGSDFVSVKDLFSEDEVSKTKTGEIIIRTYLKTNPENLNTHLNITIPKTDWTNEDFSKYEILVDEKAFIPYELEDKSKISFYNTLTAFSKLKGMVYHSRKAGKTQELILESYMVKSENNKNRVNDSIYDKIENKVTNYFFQEDNKFGKLLFRSDLYNNGDSFVMVNTCMQPIFPLNNKGDYRMITFFIYDEKSKGFFYYTIFSMRVRLGLELLAKKTNVTLFSSRVRAATVHLTKLMGIDWSSKICPFDEDKLNAGLYRTY